MDILSYKRTYFYLKYRVFCAKMSLQDFKIKERYVKMSKAKIAVVSLGHYIYFQQFEGLREELMQKSDQFKQYLDGEGCEIVDAGYVDCVDSAFDAVKMLKNAFNAYLPASFWENSDETRGRECGILPR